MFENSIEHHSVSKGYNHIPRNVIKIDMAFLAASWYPTPGGLSERSGTTKLREQRIPYSPSQVIRKEGNPTPQGTIAWIRSFIIDSA